MTSLSPRRIVLTSLVLVALNATSVSGQAPLALTLRPTITKPMGGLSTSFDRFAGVSLHGAILFNKSLGVYGSFDRLNGDCDRAYCTGVTMEMRAMSAGIHAERASTAWRLWGEVGFVAGSSDLKNDRPDVSDHDAEISSRIGGRIAGGVDVRLTGSLIVGPTVGFHANQPSVLNSTSAGPNETFRELFGFSSARPSAFKHLVMGISLTWHPTMGRDRGPVRTAPLGG